MAFLTCSKIPNPGSQCSELEALHKVGEGQRHTAYCTILARSLRSWYFWNQDHSLEPYGMSEWAYHCGSTWQKLPCSLPSSLPLSPLTKPSTFTWSFRSVLLKRNWGFKTNSSNRSAFYSKSMNQQHQYHLGTEMYRSSGRVGVYQDSQWLTCTRSLRGTVMEQRITLPGSLCAFSDVLGWGLGTHPFLSSWWFQCIAGAERRCSRVGFSPPLAVSVISNMLSHVNSFAKLQFREIRPDKGKSHWSCHPTARKCGLCFVPLSLWTMWGVTFTSQWLFFHGWEPCLSTKELCWN